MVYALKKVVVESYRQRRICTSSLPHATDTGQVSLFLRYFSLLNDDGDASFGVDDVSFVLPARGDFI